MVDRYHRYQSWSCGSNSKKRKHSKVQPCTPLGTKLSSVVVKGAGVRGPDYTGTLTSLSGNGKHFHVLRKYNIKYVSVTHSHSFRLRVRRLGYCNLEQQQIEPSTSQRTLGLEEMMGLNGPITVAVACVDVMCSYVSLSSFRFHAEAEMLFCSSLVKHFLLQTESAAAQRVVTS